VLDGTVSSGLIRVISLSEDVYGPAPYILCTAFVSALIRAGSFFLWISARERGLSSKSVVALITQLDAAGLDTDRSISALLHCVADCRAYGILETFGLECCLRFLKAVIPVKPVLQ